MSARLTRRLSTTAAAALLAVAVPAAPEASAEPAGPTPPPLGSDHSVPRDEGHADVRYTQKPDQPCLRSGLSNVEQQHTIPWAQDVLRFNELGRFATGRGQVVAVIDTGVERHRFLHHLEGGGDYVGGGNGIGDCDSHGTAVAGIIAANPGREDVGFRGIAPNAKILSIRQSSDHFEYKPANGRNALPRAGTLTTLAEAVVRAANKGATVINMSVDICRPANKAGVHGPITDDERQLQRALRYAFEERDVVLVSSAGNVSAGSGCAEQNPDDPKHPSYIVSPPWFSQYVLSVAAMQRTGGVADFSVHGPWVGVAAPGTDIISLANGDPTQLAGAVPDGKDDGKGQRIQGTSFAAPYVAGLAALIRERYQKLGKPLHAKQVVERIEMSASHPATPGGRDSEVGYGMINPVGALTTLIPGEDGVPRDHAVPSPYTVPPAPRKDWTPTVVASAGAAGGLGLLLLTLFIVHTVRRQRRDGAGPGSA